MLLRPHSGFKSNKFAKLLPQISSTFTSTFTSNFNSTSTSSDVGVKLLSKQTLSVCTCRQVSTFTALLNNRPSYEYDPKTDSFVPKSQRNQYIIDDSRRGTKLKKFLTRYMRTLFLLTGGVFWFGVLCTLVGVIEFASESDFILHLKDEDEEKRILAFYELAQSKDDLESILARDKHFDAEGVIALAKEKEEALNRALVFVRENDVVSRDVGTPVQLIGYRAATKLQHLEEENHKLECKREWNADCVLEGPQGLVSCSFAFEKVVYGEGWVLMNVMVDKMSSSGSPQLDLDIPEGGSSIFSSL